MDWLVVLAVAGFGRCPREIPVDSTDCGADSGGSDWAPSNLTRRRGMREDAEAAAEVPPSAPTVKVEGGVVGCEVRVH
jgi:hypothetical protein